MSDNTETSKEVFGIGLLNGLRSFNWLQGYKYLIRFDSSKSCVVAVKDTTLKGMKWLLRFDRPHKNVDFNHINVNWQVAGLASDPHLRLPDGSLPAIKATFQLGSFIYNAAQAIGTTVEVTLVSLAMYKDYQNGTINNTTETSAKIGGSWLMGLTGGKVGGAVGTAILPGVGTAVLGLAGSVGGAVMGAWGGQVVAKKACEENTLKILQQASNVTVEVISNASGTVVSGAIYAGGTLIGAIYTLRTTPNCKL